MVTRCSRRLEWIVALACLFATLGSCSRIPPRALEKLAASAAFRRSVVQGTAWRHVVFCNRPRSADGARLHVYIDGDGSPWIAERWIARDPTPRNPLMLRLMALDPDRSVYLGRPCYNGLADSPECHPVLWTHGRYSEAVVDSMEQALRRILGGRGAAEVSFVGYSGGGTLAMLLAERFEETHAVLTVAGNLDVAAWAAYHNYSELSGSLDPARRPPLAPGIRQLHVVGGRDRVVPPKLIGAVVARQPGATMKVYENFDHVCCWEEIWPRLLRRIAD